MTTSRTPALFLTLLSFVPLWGCKRTSLRGGVEQRLVPNSQPTSTSIHTELSTSTQTNTNVDLGELTPTTNSSQTQTETNSQTVKTTTLDSVSTDGMGSGHLKVTWQSNTDFEFDRFYIFVAKTSEAFSEVPSRIVHRAPPMTYFIGGLEENTTYKIVVKPASPNTVGQASNSLSATTLALPTSGNPANSNSFYYDELETYFNFTPENIEVGEVVTVAGKYDDGYSRSEESEDFFTTKITIPYMSFLTSNGDLLFATSNGNRVYKAFSSTGKLKAVAGNSLLGSDGDGGPATAAFLNQPNAVIEDHLGNIYFSEFTGSRIRKVNTEGVISTLVGTGTHSSSADGLPGTATNINRPYGLAIGSDNSIYFVESYGARVRKITTDGTISTIIGNSTPGSSGDGGAASLAQLNRPAGIFIDAQGQIFIADINSHRVRKIDTAGIVQTVAGTSSGFDGDGGPATAAKLKGPYGATVDSEGKIYIADYTNRRIRMVDSNGIIQSIAGTGSAGSSGDGQPATLSNIQAINVSIDSQGNILFGDALGLKIRKITPDGILETYAGNNGAKGLIDNVPATSALFSIPYGLAFGPSGERYIADYGNSLIRVIKSDGIVETFLGGGNDDGNNVAASQIKLNTPTDVKIYNGEFYIADYNGDRIRKLNSVGMVETVFGTGATTFSDDSLPATQTNLNRPFKIVLDASGNLYVSDLSHRIRKLTSSGAVVTVAGNGTSGFSGDSGHGTAAQLDTPRGLALDSIGNLFISDQNNNRVRKLNTAGIITTVVGGGSLPWGQHTSPIDLKITPEDLQFDNSGALYISTKNGIIIKLKSDGTLAHVLGTYNNLGFSGDGRPASQVKTGITVSGMQFDSLGNLYFLDAANHRLRMLKLK